MSIRERYASFGGNYDEVFGRLRSDERIERFLGLFCKDPGMQTLLAAVQNGDATEAFRAAHTLKGVSLNLSLTALAEASSELTEALRDKTAVAPEVLPLVEKVKTLHAAVVAAVQNN